MLGFSKLKAPKYTDTTKAAQWSMYSLPGWGCLGTSKSPKYYHKTAPFSTLSQKMKFKINL